MSMRKVVAAILCAVLVGSLFAGCGTTTPTDQANNDAAIQLDDVSDVASIDSEFDDVDDRDVNYQTKLVSGADTKNENNTEAETEEDVILSLMDKNVSATDDVETGTVPERTPEDVVNENGEVTVPFDIAYPDIFNSDEVEYADNAILIKIANTYSEETVKGLKGAGIGKMETMFSVDNSTWYPKLHILMMAPQKNQRLQSKD